MFSLCFHASNIVLNLFHHLNQHYHQDYHVYQVLIVESSINGYVFTYIASEEHYSEYLEEAKTVLNKIEY